LLSFLVRESSDIAAKRGYKNVSDLTPTEIAIEVSQVLSQLLHH